MTLSNVNTVNFNRIDKYILIEYIYGIVFYVTCFTYNLFYMHYIGRWYKQ